MSKKTGNLVSTKRVVERIMCSHYIITGQLRINTKKSLVSTERGDQKKKKMIVSASILRSVLVP